jgi:hypothetical protein
MAGDLLTKERPLEEGGRGSANLGQRNLSCLSVFLKLFNLEQKSFKKTEK